MFNTANAVQPSQRHIPRMKNYLGSPYGFWEYLPSGYETSTGSYPVVIYLHGIKETGSGESLDEMKKILENGVPFVIHQYKRDFPFLVISPQSPGLSDGFSPSKLDRLIEIVKSNYRVDENRIYVTGLSYGAYAALRLACLIPNKLAAVVPISSCGSDLDFEKLKNVPLWAFGNQGDKKEIPDCMNAMVDSLHDHGGTPLLTLYNRKGHNAWARTYRQDEVWDWLLKQHRCLKNENQAPILLNPGNKVVGVGALAYFRIMANDANNDSLQFSLNEDLPKASRFVVRKNGDADLILNSLIPGEYTVTVRVSDHKGGLAIQTFTFVSRYEDLFLPYLLLALLQPFVIDIPNTLPVVLILITEVIISDFFHILVGIFGA